MKQMLIPFLLLVAALPAHAQFDSAGSTGSTTSTQAPTAPGSNLVQGFRIAVSKPMLDAKIKASAFGQSSTQKEDVDATAISLGYASIPQEGLGFIAELALFEGEVDDVDFKGNRISANGTLGLNGPGYLKAGLNYARAKIKAGSLDLKFDPALGFQAGAGWQVNRNVGFELTYVSMQHGEDTIMSQGIPVDIELEETGLELGMTATF